MAQNWNRLDYTFKVMVIIALSIYGVVLCRDIVIPLSIALFLAFVSLPAVKWLERKMGTILSVSIVVVGGTLIFSLFLWILIDQVLSLVADLPNLQQRSDKFVNDIKGILWEELNIDPAELRQMVQDIIKSISVYLGEFILTTGTTLATLIQIPIYLFLLLIYRDKFSAFFTKIIPGDDEQEMVWKQEIEDVTHAYITGLLFVTLIVAALNTTGLLILGIKHAVFFGILSGILTIIPYVGIFIGATLPVVMALITKDSAWYAVGVIGVFSFVQFLEGNFITPKITGSKVSINALAAIIALVLGGKILGVTGMILAVPAIGILKILLSYSRRLKPFVILLGDTPEK